MADQVAPDSSEKKLDQRTKDISNHFLGVAPQNWPAWAQAAPPPQEASPPPQ